MLVKDYKIDPDRLTSDARLEDMVVDSIDVAELLFNIEDEFRLTLADEHVGLSTLGDVAKYIDPLIARQECVPKFYASSMRPSLNLGSSCLDALAGKVTKLKRFETCKALKRNLKINRPCSPWHFSLPCSQPVQLDLFN